MKLTSREQSASKRLQQQLLSNRSMCRFSALAALFLCILVGGAVAEEPAELLDSAFVFGSATTAEISASLEIDERGRAKTRKLRVLVEAQEGERKLFAQIVDPPFLDDIRFLSITDPQGEKSRWTATSTGVRRIADAGDDERLFGSDFTVQDLSGIDRDQFELESLPRDTINGREMHLISARDLRRRSEYPQRQFWVDVETDLVYQAKYYDGRERLVKRYRVHETFVRGGITYPELVTMSDFSVDSESTLTVLDFQVVQDIPDRHFSRAALR